MNTDRTPNPDNERLTIRSTPPNLRKRQRRSFWPAVLAEARECPGEWVRIARSFSPSTAAQVASDIRNSHRRQPGKMRISGLVPGDRWDTRWGTDERDGDEEHAYVWLCFTGDGTTAQCAAIDKR